MDDVLMLPVAYKGMEYEFPFKVIPFGYSRRFVVQVDGIELVYEPDDQGELRAIVYDPEQRAGKPPEHGLLEAIGASLRQLL